MANNIVPMCRWCNLEKGASPALGWLVHKFRDIKKAREVAEQIEQYFQLVNDG